MKTLPRVSRNPALQSGGRKIPRFWKRFEKEVPFLVGSGLKVYPVRPFVENSRQMAVFAVFRLIGSFFFSSRDIAYIVIQLGTGQIYSRKCRFGVHRH